MRRRLGVELTEAEYGALASATALAEVVWEDEGGEAKRAIKPLASAWSKLRAAWHAAP